jgi:putative redox protein
LAQTSTRSVGARYTSRVVAEGHTFIADEPAPAGDDLGPTPYELLLAALGACTSMTLLMYARRNDWPLEAVSIDLTHDRVHAQDCEECEQESGRVEVIRRSITLEGDLDDEQRERLAYIATRCPVHKTLASPPTILDEVR